LPREQIRWLVVAVKGGEQRMLPFLAVAHGEAHFERIYIDRRVKVALVCIENDILLHTRSYERKWGSQKWDICSPYLQ
jgi:hypothetical protein